jgi:hypothetical protein
MTKKAILINTFAAVAEYTLDKRREKQHPSVMIHSVVSGAMMSAI